MTTKLELDDLRRTAAAWGGPWPRLIDAACAEIDQLRSIATRLADATVHCRACQECGDGPCCANCEVAAICAELAARSAAVDLDRAIADGFGQAMADMTADARSRETERLRREVEQLRVVAGTFDKRCADALADEVAVLVRQKVIDARSPAADALLDYRDPPSSPWADRLAELEETFAWRARRATCRGDATFERGNRQRAIYAWARQAFGEDQATSLPQRGVRLLEEAIELYQACCGDAPDPAMAHKLVDYVFDRAPGEVGQEIGGVSVCLLALAAAAGCFADAEELREVERVLSRPVAEFTKRNAAKNAAGFDTTIYVPKSSWTPCDGEHGAPDCGAPQCWRREPPR